MTFKD